MTGAAQNQVIDFIEKQKLPVKKIISVQPPNSPGSTSIADDREAMAFTIKARNTLKKALSDCNVHKTHVFFFGPLGLSIFVGQMLTSVGDIQLYEYTNPGYVLSAKFKT